MRWRLGLHASEQAFHYDSAGRESMILEVFSDSDDPVEEPCLRLAVNGSKGRNEPIFKPGSCSVLAASERTIGYPTRGAILFPQHRGQILHAAPRMGASASKGIRGVMALNHLDLRWKYLPRWMLAEPPAIDNVEIDDSSKPAAMDDT